MNAVQKIKAAAAKLNPDEQVELFRWWVESDVFKQRHLASLKREIAIGIEDLERGRYQTYNDANVMRLAEEVGRSGRERIGKDLQNPEGMNQYRVSDTARSDLDEIWLYIAQDNPDAADKFMRAVISRFRLLASMPEMGIGNARNWRHDCGVFPLAITSSFTVGLKKESRSFACCTGRGIFLLCLTNPQMATMEADPTRAYDQDDATGFIRLNALRLKVAANVKRKK